MPQMALRAAMSTRNLQSLIAIVSGRHRQVRKTHGLLLRHQLRHFDVKKPSDDELCTPARMASPNSMLGTASRLPRLKPRNGHINTR